MKNIAADGASTPIFGVAILGAIAASMVGSIFSSDAWNNVTFIAGEIKNPKRNIGLSLFLGTLIVTIIYIAANLMYLSVLPLNEIANAPADRVAVAASNVIFGNIGTYVIAVMIMISTFGCNNGLILAGAAGNLIDSMCYDFFFPLNPCDSFNHMPGSGIKGVCSDYGLKQTVELRHQGFMLGSVVDMFQFNVNWPQWVPVLGGQQIFPAIWNLADACISTGVILILIRQSTYFPKKKQAEETTV